MSLHEENLARHRRLSILILLAGSEDLPGGGVANESILFDGLDAVGIDARLTRQMVRDDLKWLAERDLVRNRMVGDNLMVAHITERGVNCRHGRVIVEGVKKPSIGVL